MRLHRTSAAAGLVSVLALLALACLPVFAQASSIPQYEDSVPKATGGGGSNDGSSGGSQAEPPAKKSNTSGGATTPTNTGGGGGGGGGNNAVSGSAEGNPNSNSQPQGKADGGSGSGQQGSPANATSGQKNGNAQKPVQTTSEGTPKSDDGGSSPLVPILIAIFVLAAITLAVVLIRQRRQGDSTDEPGAPASPEAS